jgi:hypothetical protein
MLEKIKQWIKKYKIPLIILGIILTLLVALLLEQKPEVLEGLPEVVTRVPQEEEEERAEEREQEIIHPIDIDPPSGDLSPRTEDKIRIHFDKPIDIETIEYTIIPNISVALRTYDEENKVLTVFPDKIGWMEGMTYFLTISKLEGPNGTALEKPLKVEYTYVRAPVEEAGESWMTDGDDERVREYMEGHHNYEKVFGEE